jgi:hypothetical protein
MNAPFLPRVLRSYQQRSATYLYERDAAFLIAPLGAGKGAAALTAFADEPFSKPGPGSPSAGQPDCY